MHCTKKKGPSAGWLTGPKFREVADNGPSAGGVWWRRRSCGTRVMCAVVKMIEIGPQQMPGDAGHRLDFDQFLGRNTVAGPTPKGHPINVKCFGGGLLSTAFPAQMDLEG